MVSGNCGKDVRNIFVKVVHKVQDGTLMSPLDRNQLESKLDEIFPTVEQVLPEVEPQGSLLDQNHSRKLYYNLTSPSRQYGEVSRSVLMRDFWPQSHLNKELKTLTKELVRSEHGINVENRSTDLQHHVFNWSSKPQEVKPAEVKNSLNEKLISLARKRCAGFKENRFELERREAAQQLALQMEELKKSEKQEVDIVTPKKTPEQKFKFWQFPFFKKPKSEIESPDRSDQQTPDLHTPDLHTPERSMPEFPEQETQNSQPSSFRTENDTLQLEAFTVMQPQRLSKSP